MNSPTMTWIPADVVTARGADYLAEQAATSTVVVTDGGRPIAVALGPERYDDLVRGVEEACTAIRAGTATLLAAHLTR